MAYHRYVILLSAFLSYVVVLGLSLSLGRLLTPLVESYQTTRASASVVQSTAIAALCISSLLSGVAVQNVGPKLVAAAGSAICTVALVVSFFKLSLLALIICHGFLGLGFSLVYVSCAAVIPMVFKTRSKYMALSLINVGIAVGGMFYSYLFGLLSDTYSLRGTYLICGGLTLNVLALSLTWPGKDTSNNVQSEAATRGCSPDRSRTEALVKALAELKDTMKTMFTNKPFLLVVFGNIFTHIPQNMSVFFVSDAVVDRGLNPSSASLALFLYSLVSITGRVLPGTLKQIPRASNLAVLLLASSLSIAGDLLLAFVETEALILFASCLNGFSKGIAMASTPISTTILLGDKYLAPGLGLTFALTGIGIVVAGPLNGYVRDVTGSYTIVYVTTSALYLLGGLFFLVALLTRRAEKLNSFSPEK